MTICGGIDCQKTKIKFLRLYFLNQLHFYHGINKFERNTHRYSLSLVLLSFQVTILFETHKSLFLHIISKKICLKNMCCNVFLQDCYYSKYSA